MTQMTFRECCEAIIAADGQPAVNWAVGYARSGLTQTRPGEEPVQALHILNNITHWRGHTAKAVREALKEIGHVR